jgi:hypothetical protein
MQGLQCESTVVVRVAVSGLQGEHSFVAGQCLAGPPKRQQAIGPPEQRLDMMRVNPHDRLERGERVGMPS